MNTLHRHEELMIGVGPGRVWVEIIGEGEPLMLLHGGPGADSDYLIPLIELADRGFQVIRWDQLGSTRSDKPIDTSLWNVDRFREEVEQVRTALNLGTMHLLGQSWGAFLALEYALTYQEHLTSLILYSGAASTRECYDGMLGLKAAMAPEDRTTIDRYEATGETDHPDYLEAIGRLYARHLCRLDPLPPLLTDGLDHLALPVYNTMWGPNEFTCTGNLMEWDRTDRLEEISVPALVLCGRYDEVVPSCSETLHAGIRGSHLEIFEESSHLAHFEQPEAFFGVVGKFLERHRTADI